MSSIIAMNRFLTKRAERNTSRRLEGVRLRERLHEKGLRSYFGNMEESVLFYYVYQKYKNPS